MRHKKRKEKLYIEGNFEDDEVNNRLRGVGDYMWQKEGPKLWNQRVKNWKGTKGLWGVSGISGHG